MTRAFLRKPELLITKFVFLIKLLPDSSGKQSAIFHTSVVSISYIYVICRSGGALLANEKKEEKCIEW